MYRWPTGPSPLGQHGHGPRKHGPRTAWPVAVRAVSCPCQAPGRAWAGEAARGTSTGPARLVGRHVCGPFKRRSAPSSPSRRRSLAPLPLLRHAAAGSGAAPLLRRRRRSAAPPLLAAATALLPRPPPIEPPLSSGPPSIPSLATSTAGAETARGSASPRRLDLRSLASVRAFADRFRRHPRPPPSCPGRDVGTAALRGTARAVPAVLGPCPCPCRAARWPPIVYCADRVLN